MHLVEAVSLERGILEVQFGSWRIRQVHAYLLSDCCCSTIVISRLKLSTNFTPSGGRIS